MPKNKTTLKELSSILGFSISTISKALNGSNEISTITKKRVIEIAKKYNYRPNKIALGLKFGKTYTIAVIIPSVQNSFFARALYGIESVISSTKYSSIICLTGESHEKEVSNFDVLSNGVVDGFIVAASLETQTLGDFNHFSNVLNEGKSLVMFDSVIDEIPCTKVKTNDYAAISKATKNLISSNRKKILLLSTIYNSNVGKQRTEGYKKSMIDADLEPLILESNIDEIEMCLENYIIKNKIDAVIASDNDSSFVTYKVAKKLQKAIPDDIAVIGYTSELIAGYLIPELTTINQHSFTMGKTAAKLLLDQLEAKNNTHQTFIINSTLSNRNSS